MARTKGINVRSRRQPEEELASDHQDAVDEEDSMRPHKKIRLTSSRGTRLSRAQSSEQALEKETLMASPSRRSRRQPTRQESHDQEDSEQLDEDDDDAEVYGTELTPPASSRSRASRSRAKPQTPISTPRSRPSRGRPSRAMPEEEERDDSQSPVTPPSGQEEDAEEDEDVDAEVDAGENEDGNEETGVDDEGHQTVTIKGKVYRLDGEEVILPVDPEGEKKVDAKGRLQGGRQYKAYNFTSDLREDPDKVYMLTIDAARATGYRDSLYFFRKNPQILKLELLQAEKDKLIDDGRLSGQLKSRNVTMVPARNVYKLHGARIITGGRAITDDYYEADARATGVAEGKLVTNVQYEEPERPRHNERERERPKKKTDTFSYTTIDSQGDPVLTIFGDAGQSPWIRAGAWQSRKAALQRADVTEDNWMLEMARSVQGMNSELIDTRRDRLSAFPRFNRFVGLNGASTEDAVEDEIDGDAAPEDDPEALNDLPPWERERQPRKTPAQLEREAQQRRVAEQERLDDKRRSGPPIGVYEPNTHLPHFSLLTQPTGATTIKVGQRPLYIDEPAHKSNKHVPVLGGDKIGSGAWGIASFSLESLAPSRAPSFVVVPAGTSAAAFQSAES